MYCLGIGTAGGCALLVVYEAGVAVCDGHLEQHHCVRMGVKCIWAAAASCSHDKFDWGFVDSSG